MAPTFLNPLRLRTPRLQLVTGSDLWLLRLAGVAEDGIHDPAVQPFGSAWTDTTPTGRATAVCEWWWRKRDNWTPDDWALPFTVLREGEWGDVIGAKTLSARNFATQRTVSTGSWLGLPYQGHGYGTEMRTAVLNLAFTWLGAQRATSTVHADNTASIRVNEKLGYTRTDERTTIVRGDEIAEYEYTLTREQWWNRDHRQPVPIPVMMEGLTEVDLAWFGINTLPGENTGT